MKGHILIFALSVYIFTSRAERIRRFVIGYSYPNETATVQERENISHIDSNYSRKARQFGRLLPQLTRVPLNRPSQIAESPNPPVDPYLPPLQSVAPSVAPVTPQVSRVPKIPVFPPVAPVHEVPHVQGVGEVSTAAVNAAASASASGSSAGSSSASASAQAVNHGGSHFSSGSSSSSDLFFNRFSASLNTIEQLLTQEFHSFRNAFKKTYANAEEELFRKEVFIENKKKILRYNENFGIGKVPFVVKLNRFADLLNHEFNLHLNGFNRGNNTQEVKPQGSTFIPSANVQLPPSVDWRELGAVTPVKSQGLCACCYAFSAVGAIEGQIFRKTGQLRDLSAQNIIDCTKGRYGNSGCGGGLMDPSFEYVRDNLGIEAENTYPFEGNDIQRCRYRKEQYAAHDTGLIQLDEGDERKLEIAVATIGPVSAAVDASLETFQFYADGVYYDPKCQNVPEKLNHGVLVVGYGTEPTGEQYWLIKNSYGPDWGIGGYMKLAKFRGNHCGIATATSFPLV